MEQKNLILNSELISRQEQIDYFSRIQEQKEVETEETKEIQIEADSYKKISEDYKEQLSKLKS